MEVLVTLLVLAAIVGVLAWRFSRKRSSGHGGGAGGRPGADKH